MPWRETNPMNEKTKFVHRLEDGERMSDLCREFGISRKTGYKILRRYEAEGIQGLLEQSRRPFRSPNKTPKDMVRLIVELRRIRHTWGPKKLRWTLAKHYPELVLPAESTIALILKREGLVDKRKRRRRATPTLGALTDGRAPNDVWSIDFKGQFKLGNGKYCYPLTVSDHYSRYLLGCEALENTRHKPVQFRLVEIFKQHGLPRVMRSDNGVPFASTGRWGLSRLGAWMMRQGIALERIQPGQPQQNGRHERMHRTLKRETTRPPKANIFAQQELFDKYVEDFNENRPHEALKMKTPASMHQKSPRPFQPFPPELKYPNHDLAKEVMPNGSILFEPLRREIYIGQALRGMTIGLREINLDCWAAHFMNMELGYLDLTTKKLLYTNNGAL